MTLISNIKSYFFNKVFVPLIRKHPDVILVKQLHKNLARNESSVNDDLNTLEARVAELNTSVKSINYHLDDYNLEYMTSLCNDNESTISGIEYDVNQINNQISELSKAIDDLKESHPSVNIEDKFNNCLSNYKLVFAASMQPRE